MPWTKHSFSYKLVMILMKFCIWMKQCEMFSVVLDHNATTTERKVTPINSILCPGLGTAVGCMPHDKAAIQVSLGFSFL